MPLSLATLHHPLTSRWPSFQLLRLSVLARSLPPLLLCENPWGGPTNWESSAAPDFALMPHYVSPNAGAATGLWPYRDAAIIPLLQCSLGSAGHVRYFAWRRRWENSRSALLRFNAWSRNISSQPTKQILCRRELCKSWDNAKRCTFNSYFHGPTTRPGWTLKSSAQITSELPATSILSNSLPGYETDLQAIQKDFFLELQSVGTSKNHACSLNTLLK